MKPFTALFLVIILGGCAMQQPNTALKKAMVLATAQRWSGGAPGSGRGVIFTVKFYKLSDKISADSLVVNHVALAVNQSQIGDTTVIQSTFETQLGEKPTLANNPGYSGSVLLRNDDKKIALQIDEFKVLRPLNYP
jgi:hypothetical protein